MALLEKLEAGNVYLVKISASNEVGDGPFSNIVELALRRGNTHRSKNPRHSDSFPDTTGKHHETLEHTVIYYINDDVIRLYFSPALLNLCILCKSVFLE